MMKEYDAVVVDNKDPKARNRVKIRVQGHHQGDLPESELPWCLVQPRIGANSGKGQKDTLTIGQMCKVQALDKAETEFKVTGGSNAFRDPNNTKGKPYSVIENTELQSVPIPDLASLDPEKLARTIFVPLMDKLTKKIVEPVKPFIGTCGTVNPSASPTTGGCGGGEPGCGGPGIPKPGSDGLCHQNEYQQKIRCRPKALNTNGGKIDCKKYNSICGTKPITYNMKYDWEKSIQTLSGDEMWMPCLESEIDIQPACNNQCSGSSCDPSITADTSSGVWEASGSSCSGIDSGCKKRPLVCDGLALCLPENTKCSKTYQDTSDPSIPGGVTKCGLQTNKIKLIGQSKLRLNPNIPGNTVQPPIVVECEYFCGSNTCPDAMGCPGGPDAPFVAKKLAPSYKAFTLPPKPESGIKKTLTITLDEVKLKQTDTITYIKSNIVSLQSIHTQTLAKFATIKKLPEIIFGKITADIGNLLADQADKYIEEMFGALSNQADRILGQVQASAIRSINTAVAGAEKVVDNALGALGELDIDLGGIEKIPIKIMDQIVGGFGLGAVPGAFFHEVLRTDFMGQTENKIVTQYENGIAQVVDTSRGNKSWSIGTNDGARIEIASNGTTLIKAPNDVQIATESGTVSVTGANQITIIDGKATIHCDSFTVAAKTVDISADAIALNGDVEISGKLGVGKGIEAQEKIFSKVDVVTQKYKTNPAFPNDPSKDIPLKFVSLYGHLHGEVMAGTTSTGPAKG